ncbi:MAG: histidine kinase [Saprospiraceae bacterium]|nr:histidine kinase [Saprospiraceae bacterium]
MKVWVQKWLWHPYRLVFCVANDLKHAQKRSSSIYNEGGNVPLKSTVNTVLPIALAIILPGLSLYANPEVDLSSNYLFFIGWLGASIFMYLNWYVLWFLWDIKANPKRRPLLFAMIFIMVGLVTCFLYIASENGVELRGFNIVRTLLSVILFLAIQYALKTQESISQLLLEKEQIQTENYRAQLKVLQAQIDPHFLFNSLNTLRSMVRQQHAKSEKFIMSLSDFYRQTLKHNQNTTLTLSKELVVLESYLFLMKSRNEEAVQVDLEIDSALKERLIPTLALQVVVENCFKHNSMSSKRPLSIQIKNTEDDYIVVSNNIQPKLGEEESSGYGLAFLRKRYDLMDIKAGIIVEETSDEFSVKLKLI